jgi:hypothetical protein
MRITLSIVAGIIIGYTLHVKKDETIDDITNSAHDFIARQYVTVSDRFSR